MIFAAVLLLSATWSSPPPPPLSKGRIPVSLSAHRSLFISANIQPHSSKKLLCYSVLKTQKQQKNYSVTLSPKHRSSRKFTLLLCLQSTEAAEKLLCYSVSKAQKQQKIYSVTLSPKHRSSRKITLLLCLKNTEAAEKPFCYPVLQPEEARCSRLHVLLEAHASLHDVNHVVA
jgi:hypothetical protein